MNNDQRNDDNVNDNHTIYDQVCREYEHNGGITQFIKDHAEYTSNIDKLKEYSSCHGKCDFANCPSMKRSSSSRYNYDDCPESDQNDIIIEQPLSLNSRTRL